VEELLLSSTDVHGVSNVRQMEIQTAEPLVTWPHPSEAEIAVGKLKSWQN
jgi:hypothetical protein